MIVYIQVFLKTNFESNKKDKIDNKIYKDKRCVLSSSSVKTKVQPSLIPFCFIKAYGFPALFTVCITPCAFHRLLVCPIFTIYKSPSALSPFKCFSEFLTLYMKCFPLCQRFRNFWVGSQMERSVSVHSSVPEYSGKPLGVIYFDRSHRWDQNLLFHFDKQVHCPTSIQ